MTITSISDLLNAQGHFPRQRFVEYFSGKGATNIPSAIWTFKNIQGTNTGAIQDTINGGFRITTGTTAFDSGQIWFNGASGQRAFSPTSSVLIASVRNENTANSQTLVGMTDLSGIGQSQDDSYGFVATQTVSTFGRLATKNNGTITSTDGTNAINNSNLWDVRIDAQSSKIDLYFDGTLDVTNTTNLPDVKMCPAFEGVTRTTASKWSEITYLECYNK